MNLNLYANVLEQIGAIMLSVILLYLLQSWVADFNVMDERSRWVHRRIKSLRREAYWRSIALLDRADHLADGQIENESLTTADRISKNGLISPSKKRASAEKPSRKVIQEGCVS